MIYYKSYRYTLPASNAARHRGPSITEVQVKCGRKYLSEEPKGNRYFGEAEPDKYGIPCFKQESGEFSADYVLYDSLEDAELRLQYDTLAKSLGDLLLNKVKHLPLPFLKQLESFIGASIEASANDIIVNDGNISLWIPERFVSLLKEKMFE